MKKTAILILALCLVILCGCGKSEEAKAADQLILEIGEVTEASAASIEKAEKAVSALSEKDTASLDNLDILQQARADYDEILRQIDMEAAQVAIDAINEIGELAYDSGGKIEAARNAYESLEATQQTYVSNYDTLVYDEEHLSEVKIATAIKLIDEMAEVKYPDMEPLKPIQAVYKLMSEEEKALVTNQDKYLEQIDNYNRDYVKTILKDVKVWEKSGRTVELYFNFKNANEKTIKYLTFVVRFKNAVGDVVKYRDKSELVACDLTGPYKKGAGLQGTGWLWTFYSSELDTWEVASVELVSIQIEYTDGSKSTIAENAIGFLF